MEIILEYFVKAVNAILALFGKDAIVIDTNSEFIQNIKSMFAGMDEYVTEVSDSGIDM